MNADLTDNEKNPQEKNYSPAAHAAWQEKQKELQDDIKKRDWEKEREDGHYKSIVMSRNAPQPTPPDGWKAKKILDSDADLQIRQQAQTLAAQDVKNHLNDKRQQFLDDFKKNEELAKTLAEEKSKIAEAGLEKTAAAQQGQSRDYSALKTEIPSPERGFDRTTKEGRDAYREQLKSNERSAGQEITQRDYSKAEDREAFRDKFPELQKEKEQAIKHERELQGYGEKRGNDRHHYGSLKTGRTRDDDGRER